MTSPEAVERWRWWDSLRETLGESCDRQAWANIWIGVMVRRYVDEHRGSLSRFRTLHAWAKLLEWQRTPLDHDLPLHFTLKLDRFLRVGNNRMASQNPWRISHRLADRPAASGAFGFRESEYAIGRVRTLVEDIAFERANRLEAHAKMRESFIHEYGFDPAYEDLSDLN